MLGVSVWLMTASAINAEETSSTGDVAPMGDRLDRIENRLEALLSRTLIDRDDTEGGNTETSPNVVDRIDALYDELGDLVSSIDDLRGDLRGLMLGEDDASDSAVTGGPDTASVSDDGDREPLLRGTPPEILGQLPSDVLSTGQGTGVPLDLGRELGVPQSEPDSFTAQAGATDTTIDPTTGAGPQAPGADTALAATAPATAVQSVAASPDIAPRDLYDEAYRYVLTGDYTRAEERFAVFLDRHPDNEFAGNARFWFGESLFQQARYGEAARQFLASAEDHPNGPKGAESLLKLGMSLAALGETDAACSSLREVHDRYSDLPDDIEIGVREAHSDIGC